jgi:hypothetical protein
MQHQGFTMLRRWAVAGLCALAVIVLPAALAPERAPSPPAEPAFACETIDWRVANKLNALRDRTDARTGAIVSNAMLQREQARLHCRMGRIHEAMRLYGVLDRALTRYVQHGTGPALPYGLEKPP